jgi:hypothetical protein
MKGTGEYLRPHGPDLGPNGQTHEGAVMTPPPPSGGAQGGGQDARQGQVLVLGRVDLRGPVGGVQDARKGHVHLPQPGPLRRRVPRRHEAGKRSP